MKPLKGYWLRFMNRNEPRGVTIVRARDALVARHVARAVDADPGGRMLAYVLSDPDQIPHEYRNRLLNKQEIGALQKLLDEQRGVTANREAPK